MVVIINMKQVGSPSGESSGGPSRPTRPKNGSSAKGGWFSTKNKSYGSKTANDSSSKGNGGGVLEDCTHFLDLTYKQRLIGFGVSVLAAGVMFGLAFICIHLIKPTGFVLFLSFGTLSLVGSTLFLLGPVAQLKRMYHPSRIIALIIFLIFTGLAIFAGLKGKLIPAIIFGTLEILAFLWYALSFIPYARTLILKMVGL